MRDRRNHAHRPTLAEQGVLSRGEAIAALPLAGLVVVVGWAFVCLYLIALTPA